MEIKKYNQNFTVCKVTDYSEVNFNDEFVFIGKTDDELSLVCITDKVPSNVTERDDGWKMMRVQGVLDFTLIGILSKISAILADNKISIFAVSTFNTDYILVKENVFEKAVSVLSDNGYIITE